MSDDHSSHDLLHELRIDRAQRDDDGSRLRWPWIVGAMIVVLIVAGAVAAIALRGHAATVETSTAVAAASSSDAAVLQATGYVVARRQATISAQIIGTLTQVSVDEGAHVRQGQILARLDPTAYQAQLDSTKAQYAAAQAGVIKARAILQQDRANAARMNAVVARGYVSKQDAQQANTLVATDKAGLDVAIKQAQAAKDQVQAAKVNLDFSIIRAPFDGVVTDKAAEVGEIVSPYTAGGGGIAGGLATIVDMNSLEVDVDVNEAYISRVTPDQPAKATLDAYPDWNIPAHVIAIIPTADRSKATVKVRVAIDQKDPRILPDMGVRVSFESAKTANEPPPKGVLVPASSIVTRAGKSVVFEVDGDRAREHTVNPGQSFGDLRLVQEINPGMHLVRTPPEELKDGTHVAIKQE